MEELRVGQRVRYQGREYVVRGVDPMSVPERRVYLRDLEDGTIFIVAARALGATPESPPTPPDAA